VKLSIAQLQGLAIAHQFPDPPLAAAIAFAESGGDTGIVGDVKIGGSVGLWQVYLPSHRNYDPAKLIDPDYNAKAAFDISSGGKNWHPWSTYHMVPDPTAPGKQIEVGDGNGAFKPYYKPGLTPIPWVPPPLTLPPPFPPVPVATVVGGAAAAFALAAVGAFVATVEYRDRSGY
jgi:hypothetical protein